MATIAGPVAAPPAGPAPVHGSSSPERTRERVEPMLARFGITRVADLTGLDELGVPVYAAYRPGGTTLSVSLGVAADPARAWVGAVMESIEIWHTENLVLPVRRASAEELGVPYDVRALTLAPHSPLTPSTVLDWVPGRGMLSGAPAPVPRGLVELDLTTGPTWDDVLFSVTSNGTAVGATHAEALLHATLEVAERDACAGFAAEPPAEQRHVDPDASGSPAAAALLAPLRAAGCHVGLREVTNELGLPTFVCTVWDPGLPVAFTGFGTHLDAGAAVSRALAEATLVRVGTVSGARDDLDDDVFAATGDAPRRPETPPVLRPPGPSVLIAGGDGAPAEPWEAVRDLGPVAFAQAAARTCAERIRRRTGWEPVAVDLTHPDVGIPAVKVVAPGLRMFGDDLDGRRAGAGGGRR